MDVAAATFLIIFIHSCHTASIYPKNDTLETFKNDISNVGSAIENFTFDILRNILEDSEETDTTTSSPRKTRSVNDPLELCQKRCQDEHAVETQRIQDLKSEMKRLQELVKVLQQQQKIINILDDEKEQPSTKKREENEDHENVPNNEQLALIKSDLKEAIESLNQTKEFVKVQQQKSEILEQELMEQQQEITELKEMVDSILEKNETRMENSSSVNQTEKDDGKSRVSARSSEMSEIRKLLKNLPDDEDTATDEEDIRTKLVRLQKMLQKKKRQEQLDKELKQLEKSLSNDSPKDLLQQLIKAIRNSEPESKTDSVDISNLDELKEAIDGLRPKENNNNDAAQFQAMLNKLINRPSSTPPSRPGQITITPQQMVELTKKLNPNSRPYICIVDESGVKSGGYRVPVNSRNFQYVDTANQKPQFFPVQFTQPNYYPQAGVAGVGPEKSFNYQSENVDINQRYREDLKSQIDGIQAAIDNLNKPEYVQNPEDRTVIDNLEQQITDLRGVVDNLNYPTNRTKRSLEDNKVDDGKELLKEMKNIVGKMLEEETTPKNLPLEDIQNKIDILKSQLGGDSNNERAANSQTYAPNFSDFSKALINPPTTKTSVKNDFFADVVSKILDKVISVIPIVIQKLLGFSLEELSKNDYSDYDVQVLFKNLGIFAYLPVILLRLVRGFGAFLSVLKKNAFFKNFLMPAAILATVAGSVLFLIWWLQPEDNYSNYQYPINYAYPDNTNLYDQNNNNKYPVTPNYPPYTKSYYSQ